MTWTAVPDWTEKPRPDTLTRRNVIAISADKGYKTTRKPNHSPTVLNNIISKSSVCPYILEGWIVGPLKLLYWPKINRKRGFSRLRVTRWFLSNDPNNSAKGLAKFLLYLEKMYEPFNSLRLNPTEKYYAQHAQKAQSRFSCHQQQWTRKLTDQAKLYISFDFSVILKKDFAETECATMLLIKLTMLLK